jgi:hypothetical protein
MSRGPSASKIIEAAAKRGINVRIHYGPHGKIDTVETVGKADQTIIAPNADANEKNPWDEVLNDAAE